jgi:hypothetical protein
MSPPVECAIYAPDHGDTVRILIEDAGEWRPILWMEVSEDGSVYVGPRKVVISELRHGIARRLDDDHIRVLYSDGLEIADEEVRKKAKLSFHASGIVNAPMGRATRNALRSLESQELLCLVLFQHPKEFGAVPFSAVRKRDVCLRYPIDEQRPIWARLYIAPDRKSIPVLDDSVAHQLNLVFEYPASPKIDAVTLQVVLSHGPKGPWPPYTYMLFEAVTADRSPPNQPMQPTPQSGAADG